MIERLLSHLYSALSPDPKKKSVALVRHPGGHVREVADDVLRAWRKDGSLIAEIPLADKNVGDLLEDLANLGFEVQALDGDAMTLSALALLEGNVDEDSPGGAYLTVPSSALWHVLRPIARELSSASRALDSAKAQMYLASASDEWLDYWGAFFGLPRNGMDDAAYRRYLIAETLRPRSNPRAIEAAVRDAIGASIQIYEPFGDVFRLSRSELNRARLHDSSIWTHGVIVPVADIGTDFSEVLPVIHRNRPAGVVIRGPLFVVPVFSADYDEGDFSGRFSSVSTSAFRVYLPGDPRLGEYVLDVDEWLINHRFGWYEARSHFGYLPKPVAAYSYGPRTVDMASVIMSDGFVLGDPRSVFGRGVFEADSDWRTRLSDLPALGDGIFSLRLVRYDRVFCDVRPLGAQYDGATTTTFVSDILTALHLRFAGDEFAVLDGSVALNPGRSTSFFTGLYGEREDLKADVPDPRSIDRASVALSDGFAVGEPESAFGRGEISLRDGSLMTRLSDLPALGAARQDDYLIRYPWLHCDSDGVLVDASIETSIAFDPQDWRVFPVDCAVPASQQMGEERLTAKAAIFGVDFMKPAWGDMSWSDVTWANAQPLIAVRHESA